MKKLTADQARAVQAVIEKQRQYLMRLQERLKVAGIEDKDVIHHVNKARDAVNDLWVALHYASCSGGVSPPSLATGHQGPPAGEGAPSADG